MKKGILGLIFALALLVCVGSAGYMGYRYLHDQRVKEEQERLQAEMEATEVEKIDIKDVLSLEFNGERDGITSQIPGDVFTDDSNKKIDFDKLREYNEELVAWIYVQGTKIDYPIARHEGEDQSFYLNYDMYKEPSYSGCIYMEDVNEADFSSVHTILYGHNMKNGTMFKGLHLFEEEKFFDENKYIYIYLPDRTLVYEIFAAYMTDDTYLPAAFDFDDEEVYGRYLDHVTDVSYMGGFVRKGTTVTTDNQIITLSTCVGGMPDNRYIVQGVMKYDKESK